MVETRLVYLAGLCGAIGGALVRGLRHSVVLHAMHKRRGQKYMFLIQSY